jgi:ferrous iron transport protein A
MKKTFNFDQAQVRLDELPMGLEATIEAVDSTESAGRRLLDLGLLPGTSVVAVRRAPLGDPTVYEFRGTRLCLRHSEARRVRVRVVRAVPGAAR